MLLPNQHFSLSAQMNGTLLSPYRMYYMYYGMPKGTCLTEVMSNSEKIMPIALAATELCFSEGIGQSVSYSVSQ